MKNYFKISLGIFVALAASRFLPHPPNFTSLIALGFYVPALLGLRFIPAIILSFAITDFFIGFHYYILFTWGSIVLIGLIPKCLFGTITKRLSGALIGSVLFFVVTNFGVWTSGLYEYTFEGLIYCYTLALPFFAYNIISTFIFSAVIETLLKFKFFEFFSKSIK